MIPRQADADKTGTLSLVELAGAMRNVMGVTPKKKETERALRFWGQISPNEGEAQSMLVGDGQCFGKRVRADCAQALFPSQLINLTLSRGAYARLFVKNMRTRTV